MPWLPSTTVVAPFTSFQFAKSFSKLGLGINKLLTQTLGFGGGVIVGVAVGVRVGVGVLVGPPGVWVAVGVAVGVRVAVGVGVGAGAPLATVKHM